MSMTNDLHVIKKKNLKIPVIDFKNIGQYVYFCARSRHIQRKSVFIFSAFSLLLNSFDAQFI